ncbi:MAG: hypothetical protein ACR2F8_13020 [Caulobacteraceae bacterium]
MLKPFAAFLLIACAGAARAQAAPAPPPPSLADVAMASRPYAYAPPPRLGDEARTALDYAPAPRGLAASVGFVCDNDGHAPVLHDLAPLAGSQPGRLIGTTLRLPF